MENAHPHVDCSGRLALIHNGIIENHAELKAELEAAGHTLVSATDTEVLAHLIEAKLAAGAPAWPRRRGPCCRRLRGSFSIAVVSRRRARHHCGGPPQDAARPRAPGRRGLPRLGHPGAHRPHPPASSRWPTTRWPSSRPARWRSPRSTATPVEPEQLTITWDLEAAQKGGFEDYMSKEIHEQPQAVADTLLDRRGPGGGAHPRRNAAEPRRAAQHRQGVHRGVRLELPRRPGGQVRH